MNDEKIFGLLKTISLNKLSKISKDKTSTTLANNYFFELNLFEMTLGYKCKQQDKNFKRLFGYKQFFKYTLQLTGEEESFAKSMGEYKLGFKLIFENKSILLFCRTVMDLKMWIEGFKKFFYKKSAIMTFLLRKREQEREMYNKNLIEEGKVVDQFLINFSNSFTYGHGGLIISDDRYQNISSNFKESRTRKKPNYSNSIDRIFCKNKTSSSMFSGSKCYFNKPINLTLYKSKLLKNLQNVKMPIPKTFKKEVKKKDTTKFRNFLNYILIKYVKFYRLSEISSLVSNFRQFSKEYRDKKMLENFAVANREMEEEWDFYITDVKEAYGSVPYKKFSATEHKKQNIPMNSKKNKIDREKLKDQVTLLGEEKNLKILSEINKHQGYTTIKDTTNTSINLENFDEADMRSRSKPPQQKANFSMPKYNENCFAHINLNYPVNILNDNDSNNKTADELIDFAPHPDIEPVKYVTRTKSRMKEIKINEVKQVLYKDDESYFIFQMNKLDETDHEPIITRSAKNKLVVFPKNTEVHKEEDFQDPHSIDYQHLKHQNISLSINLDEDIDDEEEIKVMKEKRTNSYIESPHFGNIAIIAQRYNKIDNIDDWKAFINK